MEENKKILECWQKEIEMYPKISFKEAKNLYHIFLSIENNQEKQNIRDKIILGTLHLISNYINNNILYFAQNSLFDMNDVINASIEEWIKKIDAGVLETISRPSHIFNSTFTSSIIHNLIGNNYSLNENTALTVRNFSNVLISYLKLKQKECTVSYYDFLNLLDEKTIFFSEELLYATYNILNTISNLLVESEISIGKDKVDKFKYLLIHYALELLRIDLSQIKCITTEELVISHLYDEEVANLVLKSNLSDREKTIIQMCFGLGNTESKSIDEISSIYMLSRCRILQIEAKALRKLRHPSRLQKIKIHD